MISTFSGGSKAAGLALVVIGLAIGRAKSTADPKAASEEEPAWSPPGYVVESTGGVITVDGRLNEPDWIRGRSVGDFVFPWWDESKGEKDQTVAKILWDDLNLYVGFLCYDPYIWAEITETDGPVYPDDCVEIFLSPDREDVERTYSIEINAIGTILDSFRQPNPDGSIAVDRSWDAQGMKVAYSHRGTLNNDSDQDTLWIMEVVMPLSNFGLVAKNIPPKDKDVWRLNLNRCGGKTKMQYSQWSSTGTPEPNFHVPSRFGQVYFSSRFKTPTVE